jgi:hypothetical protein
MKRKKYKKNLFSKLKKNILQTVLLQYKQLGKFIIISFLYENTIFF